MDAATRNAYDARAADFTDASGAYAVKRYRAAPDTWIFASENPARKYGANGSRMAGSTGLPGGRHLGKMRLPLGNSCRGGKAAAGNHKFKRNELSRGEAIEVSMRPGRSWGGAEPVYGCDE
jgi:hypothetical protein